MVFISLLFFICSLIILIGTLIVGESQALPYLIGVTVMFCSLLILFGAILSVAKAKLTIAEDEIVITSFHKKVSRYKINDIEQVVYYNGFRGAKMLFIVLKGQLAVDRRNNELIIVHGSEYIALDYSKKNLDMIKQVWKGEIEN